MNQRIPFDTVIHPSLLPNTALQHYPADVFPTMHPIDWLHSHFAVGGWSPLQRLSGMLTAHMTRIAPHAGFDWHPHRGLEIYTWVLEGQVYHEDTTGGQGVIGPGELQRMFSGEWIEHKELNMWDEPTRVIQIWFAAGHEHRDVEPHYQQLSGAQLPNRQLGDATVYSLIGDHSPMQQHVEARLTATTLNAGGKTQIEAPHADESLFLYVTDGSGKLRYEDTVVPLGQYDVILARPSMLEAMVEAGAGASLDYLSFYLPPFLPELTGV